MTELTLRQIMPRIRTPKGGVQTWTGEEYAAKRIREKVLDRANWHIEDDVATLKVDFGTRGQDLPAAIVMKRKGDIESCLRELGANDFEIRASCEHVAEYRILRADYDAKIAPKIEAKKTEAAHAR